MDRDALYGRREARRRALRRRRLLGVLALAGIAAIAIALLAGVGGASKNAGHQVRTSAALREGHAGTPGAQTAQGTASGPPGHQPIPILMYHVIAAPPPGAPFPGLYVTPAEFGEQMQSLKSAGWHAVTLDQAAAYWDRGAPLPAGKPIVLTFDNGYKSQYTQALPVLQRLGWAGDENIQLTGLPPSQGGLTESQVRGLLAAGWELDTQGFSHADLITLDPSRLHYEVAVARQALQSRYGVPVNWFCYPSGHYDATVVAAVQTAGYRGSTTVVPGWAHPGDDSYRLHRLRVLGGTSGAQLLALVDGSRSDAPAPASYSGG